VAINDKGTLMVSTGNQSDVVLWSTDWNQGNCVKDYFAEGHENQIDTVAFAPLATAKTITRMLKALIEKESEGEGEEGEEKGAEEAPKASKLDEQKDKMAALREKLAQKKALMKGRKDEDGARKEEEPEEKEEVDVRFDFVATGSRDKMVIVWNAQRG
jgi:hypothetical protein